MDRVDAALALAMLCLLAGTLLAGFSRPLWWMFHRRGPNGRRPAPEKYEWLLRVPGILLLVVAAGIIGMSVMGLFPFQ